MVEIVTVQCRSCGRKFRTVVSVIEHLGPIHCPRCGTRMDISPPQALSVLSQGTASAA